MGFIGISMVVILFALVSSVKFFYEFAAGLLNEIEMQAQQRRRNYYNRLASF